MASDEKTTKDRLQNGATVSLSKAPQLTPQYQHAIEQSALSASEKQELLLILKELFQGYPVKEINLQEVILDNGEKFNWRPPKESRTEDDVLNNPSLIEQCLPIYIAGPQYKSHPHHDGHAGRIRNLDFLKAIYGKDEEAVKRNLVNVQWLEKVFGNSAQIILVNRNLEVSKKIQAISKELESLSQKLGEPCLKYLKDIGGTFAWRTIANTNRLSAHAFGMTLDLNASLCEYWLWDYKLSQGLQENSPHLLQESDIPSKEIPAWRNSVPWEIVEIFEKHGFIWGGKWNKYDTMHFEYRPECFVNPEVKLRLRELLAKEGYTLLAPLPVPFPSPSTSSKRVS